MQNRDRRRYPGICLVPETSLLRSGRLGSQCIPRYDSIHTADGGARQTRISAGYEVWMLGWPLDPVILIATLMSDQSGKKENDIRHIGDQDQNDDHGDEHGENLLDNPSYGCAGYARYDEQQHSEWWCG